MQYGFQIVAIADSAAVNLRHWSLGIGVSPSMGQIPTIGPASHISAHSVLFSQRTCGTGLLFPQGLGVKNAEKQMYFQGNF